MISFILAVLHHIHVPVYHLLKIKINNVNELFRYQINIFKYDGINMFDILKGGKLYLINDTYDIKMDTSNVTRHLFYLNL